MNNLQMTLPPEFSLEDMEFFSIGWVSRPNLNHHIYGPAMEVPLVVLDTMVLPYSFQSDSVGKRGKLRYTSDGVRSSVELVN